MFAQPSSSLSSSCRATKASTLRCFSSQGQSTTIETCSLRSEDKPGMLGTKTGLEAGMEIKVQYVSKSSTAWREGWRRTLLAEHSLNCYFKRSRKRRSRSQVLTLFYTAQADLMGGTVGAQLRERNLWDRACTKEKPNSDSS